MFKLVFNGYQWWFELLLIAIDWLTVYVVNFSALTVACNMHAVPTFQKLVKKLIFYFTWNNIFRQPKSGPSQEKPHILRRKISVYGFYFPLSYILTLPLLNKIANLARLKLIGSTICTFKYNLIELHRSSKSYIISKE